MRICVTIERAEALVVFDLRIYLCPQLRCRICFACLSQWIRIQNLSIAIPLEKILSPFSLQGLTLSGFPVESEKKGLGISKP